MWHQANIEKPYFSPKLPILVFCKTKVREKRGFDYVTRPRAGTGAVWSGLISYSCRSTSYGLDHGLHVDAMLAPLICDAVSKDRDGPDISIFLNFKVKFIEMRPY